MADELPKIELSAVQMAKNLLEQGEAIFIGDSCVVEIATRLAPSDWPKSWLSAIGQFDAGGWKYLTTIKPVSKVFRDERDTAKREIMGEPGSRERVESLAKWQETMGEDSPFKITDDEMATRLATVLGAEGMERLGKHLERVDNAPDSVARRLARLAALPSVPTPENRNEKNV